MNHLVDTLFQCLFLLLFGTIIGYNLGTKGWKPSTAIAVTCAAFILLAIIASIARHKPPPPSDPPS